MTKPPEEWLAQADYDIETAEFMSGGGRNFYALFMCHLALEKALKSLYRERLGELPPKVHNLVYLLNKIDIRPPEELAKFIIKISEASVPTRYPEDIELLKREYTSEIGRETITMSKKVLQWIKQQF